MNVKKEYNTAKKQKGNVSFGALGGGRWVFRCSDKESGAIEKVLQFSGGHDVAEKIAEVISKSWKRTAGKKKQSFERLDTACRTAIDRLCQLRTLKDWEGEPEWWSNALADEPQVTMIYVNRPTNAPVVQPEGISAEDLAQEMALERATESAVESQELVPAQP